MDRGVISWTPLGRFENFGRLPRDVTCESGCISHFFDRCPIRRLSIARKLSIHCETTLSRISRRSRDCAREVWDFYMTTSRRGWKHTRFPRYLSSDEEIGLLTLRSFLTRHLRSLVNSINRTRRCDIAGTIGTGEWRNCSYMRCARILRDIIHRFTRIVEW